METNKKIIIIILTIVVIILAVVCIIGLTNNNTETIEINDLNIEKDAFGIYNLVGHITPLKDFDYLEARIVFYDNQSTVIGKSSCAWNILDVSKGSKISVGNSLGATCDGIPSYAVIEFYDSVYSDTPLKNFTVRFNNTEDTSDDSNSGVVSSSSNDNNKYSDEDLQLARDEGYWEGYADSYSDNYYSDDDYYSDDVEATTDDYAY